MAQFSLYECKGGLKTHSFHVAATMQKVKSIGRNLLKSDDIVEKTK